MTQALELLTRVFGYPSFRGRQEEVIAHAEAGGSCLVLMPTGGGKSLCYQIPALLRPGLGLVISPLIALMQDQVGALRLNGLRAEFYNSSLEAADKARVRSMARSGELDLLYVAPETLNTDFFTSFISEIPLSLIAVDEAHCVAQWGHDFRPDYLQIAALRERFPDVPLVALTATADEATRKEILARLKLEGQPVFASSFDRANIQYQITLKDSGREQLLEFIKARHAGEAGIIYCLSRKKVDETAAWLMAKGVAALPYHAGLDAATRRKNQDRFLTEEGLSMVATIAFGMGIDKPNVRFVAHLDLPKSVESYYQETGRAGRDGEPASAWMAYSLGDVVQLRQMIQGGEGSADYKRLSQQKLNAMLGLCEAVQCRRQALLKYFGEQHAGDCQNCDNCLEAPKAYDGTESAQKALSAIARCEERFGAGQLTDVLMGKETEKVKRFGHDRLSVFGIGKEKNEKQWSSVYRQLAAAEYLSVDLEGYGAFKLNERSWKILKGTEKIMLREDPAPRIGKKERRATAAVDLGGPENETFQALRALRLRLATEQSLPPYVIFHDSALREMALRRPSTLVEFARIPGVGQAKLSRYGADFLRALHGPDIRVGAAAASPPAPKNESQAETLRLAQEGLAPAAIALKRTMAESTIWDHLASLIEEGALKSEDVLDLKRSELDEILVALAESQGKLKPVFERFQGKHSYDIIKCVRAGALDSRLPLA